MGVIDWLFIIVQSALIILKLLDIIKWGWSYVFIPLYIYITITAMLIILFGITFFIISRK